MRWGKRIKVIIIIIIREFNGGQEIKEIGEEGEKLGGGIEEEKRKQSR